MLSGWRPGPPGGPEAIGEGWWAWKLNFMGSVKQTNELGECGVRAGDDLRVYYFVSGVIHKFSKYCRSLINKVLPYNNYD
jgi:hypothetical protein